MNLQELGNEYFKQYKILMEKVAEIKKQYAKASPEVKRKNRIRMKELMSTALYLKQTAEKLMNYYEKSARRYTKNEEKHTES